MQFLKQIKREIIDINLNKLQVNIQDIVEEDNFIDHEDEVNKIIDKREM